MYRAVVHVPDGERVLRGLKNIRNLLDDLAEEVDVVLVLNGNAVEALVLGSPHAALVRELLARGARIAACGRALRNRGLADDPLVEGVTVVPGGVTEVVRLQADGFAYLRP